MTTSLLTMPVCSRQDVVAARQRGRQIARLLGFDRRQQAVIAANVFEIARQTYETTRRGTLHFRLRGNTLQVFPSGVVFHHPRLNPQHHPSAPTWNAEGVRRLGQRLQQIPSRDWTSLRLDKPLPPGPLAVAREDLPWMVQELMRCTPLDLFEEFQHQNQELLVILEEMPADRSKVKNPAA